MRRQLAEEKVELAGKLEEIWEMLVVDGGRRVVRAAGRLLKVPEGGYGSESGDLDAVGVLWELLVAEEREAPPSDHGRPGQDGNDVIVDPKEETAGQNAVRESYPQQETER